METKQLRALDGTVIPVLTARHDGALLLECREPGLFLRDIPEFRELPPLPPNAFVRGVVKDGQDSIFQVFDQFGTLSGEFSLGRDQTRTILQRLC